MTTESAISKHLGIPAIWGHIGSASGRLFHLKLTDNVAYCNNYQQFPADKVATTVRSMESILWPIGVVAH